MRHFTPLRYPGGKARLANFVKAILKRNCLEDAHYVEPYAGGASVALELLLNEHVTHVHINDIDCSVFAFWHCVLNETQALCDRIRKAKLSIAEWQKQRAIQRRAPRADLLALGFSTFYLNRTNRSGIIFSGGPIGGLKQSGKWKLDARFYRDTLIARIESIARYRDRITLSNLDGAAFLRDLLPTMPKKSMVYLDPPYYIKGRRRLYSNSYEHSDHAEIATLMSGYHQPWLVSYDDVREIRTLYKGYRHRKYRLQYTARDRYQGAEVVFFSHDLALPTPKKMFLDGGLSKDSV